MNRKQFIQQSSVLAAGMLYAPTIFGKNRPQEEIILGHNNKRYRLDTKWSQLNAAQYPVKDCHEMVQDKAGRIILLTNETKNNVIVYDRSGKLITSWGHEYP
ncbi:MAG TPA: 6-bladed beta-propeller, partial [Chitinophagaceae bacterium]|nr:6-bladed beta-propeller [Chitinophagaceae bacterium]